MAMVKADLKREPYDGFWGGFECFWTGGIENGYRYDIDGNCIGNTPVMGVPPLIGGSKSTISAIKASLRVVHQIVGKQKKWKKGKFGSPQYGNGKKGYRLDPGHKDRAVDEPEFGPHINWWNYTGGKRKSGGGSSGAIPIK